MYYLIVLLVESLKWVYGAKIKVLVHPCLKTWGENPFPCIFYRLEITCIPVLMALFLHLQSPQGWSRLQSTFLCFASSVSPPQFNSGLEITYKLSLKFWVVIQRKLELYPKTKYLEQQNHSYHIPTTNIISPRVQTQSLKHHSQFLGSQSTLGNKWTFCVTSQSWSYAPEIWWEVSFSHFNSVFSQKFTEIVSFQTLAAVLLVMRQVISLLSMYKTDYSEEYPTFSISSSIYLSEL